MKHIHSMPLGARLLDGGGVEFRLWAPAAQRVEIELHEDGELTYWPMYPEPQGWQTLTLEHLARGARYKFRIDEELSVPDPASRFNPDDVHGASEVIDPGTYDWPDDAWQGRPWEEAVIYELHVGTITPEGTFAALAERLETFVVLGATAIEIMPVADFPGTRNWGYDGVLPFAPDASYGRPEELKILVARAHALGLMVFLDVVYNHFGPEGNYLHRYAPQFFSTRHQTPWGAAINFDGEGARTVRDFFVHNALYWIEEFHVDGLRLDAVHAIVDESELHIVSEIARAIQAGPGRERHVHVILENDRNEAHRLCGRAAGDGCSTEGNAGATAQWNDDFHHALHVLATGERDGYYEDYADKPLWYLGRCLSEGYAYQGERSRHRGGQARGEDSRGLAATAFIDFTQSHDQVGNRALGERIAMISDARVLRLGLACLLLSPAIPMLFMGEEFAAGSPFLYFCDYAGELADAVRNGRRREFAAFERFRDPAAQAAIPDPNAETTFLASKLRWEELNEPPHAEWLALYRQLLDLRQRAVVPLLRGEFNDASFDARPSGELIVDWRFADGELHLRANFSDLPWEPTPAPVGEVLYATHGAGVPHVLPAWGGIWTLEVVHA